MGSYLCCDVGCNHSRCKMFAKVLTRDCVLGHHKNVANDGGVTDSYIRDVVVRQRIFSYGGVTFFCSAYFALRWWRFKDLFC